MTVVVAYKFFTTVVVVADCRVSYRTGNHVDDNLRKIYPIGKRMVLGFSGPLRGAHAVVEAVRRNWGRYRKRPVASNLERDVERWIRHEYRKIRPAEARTGLSFILAAVEPHREALFNWHSPDGKEMPAPNWSRLMPDMRVSRLRPLRCRPTELVKEKKSRCKVIGVGAELRDAIHSELDRLFDFARERPKLQAGVSVCTLMHMLMEAGVETVGGLFQCAVLDGDGIEWLAYSSPSTAGSVALEYVEGQYVQRDNRTGKTVPVKSIGDWWKDWHAGQLPGDAGVFEDPGLRKAIDDLRKSETLTD